MWKSKQTSFQLITFCVGFFVEFWYLFNLESRGVTGSTRVTSALLLDVFESSLSPVFKRGDMHIGTGIKPHALKTNDRIT